MKSKKITPTVLGVVRDSIDRDNTRLVRRNNQWYAIAEIPLSDKCIARGDYLDSDEYYEKLKIEQDKFHEVMTENFKKMAIMEEVMKGIIEAE